jgi:hypothetical protein
MLEKKTSNKRTSSLRAAVQHHLCNLSQIIQRSCPALFANGYDSDLLGRTGWNISVLLCFTAFFLKQFLHIVYCNLLHCHTCSFYIKYCSILHCQRGGAVDWSTALQTGQWRVRFSIVSLKFSIDIVLSVALWPWVRLSLKQRWVPRIFSRTARADGA